jgi:Bacterial Ig-like domain (group 3)
MVAFKSMFPNGTSVTLGTAALDATGTAVFSMNQLVPASHTIFAVYLGDGNNAGSTSAQIIQVVQKADTTLTLTVTSASAASVSGKANALASAATVLGRANALASAATSTGPAESFSVSLAVVPPGQPIVPATGTITFYDTYNGVTTALITLVIGQSGTTPALTGVGTHIVTAVYSGDSNYNGSTAAPVTVVVTAPPS